MVCVIARGRATAAGATRYVVKEDDASIYVGAPAAALGADAERLSPFRTGRIAGRAGDAFLRLRSIRP